MEYLIYRTKIPSQYIDLQLTLEAAANETITLQLPSWRPGRYELANYAQKLRGLYITAPSGERVALHKVSKDRWYFSAGESGKYSIQYQFHASQMDAGGSWSDDEQLYINFINLAFQVLGREEEKIIIKLDLPSNYRVATALPSSKTGKFIAEGFQHLVDSPLIASATLKHYQYQVYAHTFHLWFQGDIHFDMEELLEQFYKFTQRQIDAFGAFPAADYHFLFQLLPYPHYHGVEHQYSTVITLGPAEDLATKTSLDRLMGVSSHELYHFWNVCRIRPKELLPYDFSQEAYINTGMVAEGVTTYMGDLFLWKSGYYSDEAYFAVLETLINREFEQFGWRNQSIAESSWDLWLDGYKAGAPHRKVSIYNRGALLSLCTDLLLLEEGSSLSKVMKMMWQRFGQPDKGYSLGDFQAIITEELKDNDTVRHFFDNFIFGTTDLLPYLVTQLETVGLQLEAHKMDNLASAYGIMVEENMRVKSVHPDSPAYEVIMIGDIVKSEISETAADQQVLELSVFRGARPIAVELPFSTDSYFMRYQITKNTDPEKFSAWKKGI